MGTGEIAQELSGWGNTPRALTRVLRPEKQSELTRALEQQSSVIARDWAALTATPP